MDDKIKASTLLVLGKEAQDVIQAWVDPDMTKGKIAEMNDLAPQLWNLSAKFPAIGKNIKEFFAWIAQGISLETMREYFSDDLVEWDLELEGFDIAAPEHVDPSVD